MAETFERITTSAAQTRALAACLARFLPPGSVLALSGDLGAGKTCFVSGLAEGLGIEEAVTSPTYTLMHEYRSGDGARVLLHFDAWMAGRERGFLEGGGAEWLATPALAAVEWAERVAEYLPDPYLAVQLEHVSEPERRVRLVVMGAGDGSPSASELQAAIVRTQKALVAARKAPAADQERSEPRTSQKSSDGPNRGDPRALG